MRVVADFHLHSKYSRATSRDMDLDNISKWANFKGIDLVGTADFTHPFWFSEIKKKLEQLPNGLLKLKDGKGPNFILTTEISNIYTWQGKVRKIHLLIFAPSIDTVLKINNKLSTIGNLYADGRPIIGISAYNLAQIIFDIDPRCVIVPAHAWTPWFSIFGSKSGFDKIEECFQDLSDKIFAIETGLSSDAQMNWRLSALDKISLISCSDAHSPQNLGRELTVFDLPEPSYEGIMDALKTKNPQKILYTVEFFPEEGKYHFDGHRACNIVLSPKEAKTAKNICPVCKKPLTIGVLHRVDDLADRDENYQAPNFPGFKKLVPLQEVIAISLGQGKVSQAVMQEYLKLINIYGNEFNILVDTPLEKLTANQPKVLEGIKAMRQGQIKVEPGYDGVYGKVEIILPKDELSQESLF
ncbi:MAG: DNA helicase UvrD [Candidatus Nealsonbacteria bacterium CG23_combo_of_CG06-09_8_20_14_all_40_13]|uniref:DNA helicase UvrD n=1 Tax=Candidatus Nealsonbacteria bacterium CG23_combo_of_CG06-09_8_20_14_all_40_13 TaxID=1974724 RepID=A0A2G9YTQ7_9BACT|nr:MAG: DNA helicase UvrD [Candidatus Nealsonbacteria bacterium CG23_combo_of_CG06-09_8_20_14_all_40_13]